MDIQLIPPGHAQMRSWNVIKIKELGTFHIAGYEISGQRWRISTEVRELDTINLTAKTRSGSQYSFIEPRGIMHPSVVEVLDASLEGYSVATDEELIQFKPQKTVEGDGEQ